MLLWRVNFSLTIRNVPILNYSFISLFSYFFLNPNMDCRTYHVIMNWYKQMEEEKAPC